MGICDMIYPYDVPVGTPHFYCFEPRIMFYPYDVPDGIPLFHVVLEIFKDFLIPEGLNGVGTLDEYV
jgi:hypothetical protein